MKKKKTLFVIIICISAFITFAIITKVIYNSILNNPIDIISITYIRNNTDIETEYGEIIYVGKNVLYKTEKNDHIIKSPYTIETETGRVIAYVTLEKNNETWNAVSIEVVEVQLIEH